jgi:hypothetical protein
VNIKLSSFHKAVNEPTEQRYGHMDNINSDDIGDLIFADDAAVEAIRRKVIGSTTREEFEQRLDNGRDRLKRGRLDLLVVFKHKSFPETYFNASIAKALCATGKLTNPATLEERVDETTEIILTALYDLPVMLAVAESHKRRPPPLYTADTVEFTLLTFSYFGAKKCGINDGDWFFLWKVFGSMLGLPPERLPDNLDQAKGHMHALRGFCPWPPGSESARLLDSFVNAYLHQREEGKPDLRKTDAAFRDLVKMGAISKRMREYLKLRKRWPPNLPDHLGPDDD